MCYKVIPEIGRILMFILDRYKDQNVCNKAVDNYPHALESALIAIRAEKMFN